MADIVDLSLNSGDRVQALFIETFRRAAEGTGVPLYSGCNVHQDLPLTMNSIIDAGIGPTGPTVTTSDKPPFYKPTAPGFPKVRQGIHYVTLESSFSVPANSYQMFTWLRFSAIRMWIDPPYPPLNTTLAWSSGGAVLVYTFVLGSANPDQTQQVTRPYAGYFNLSAEGWSWNNPNAVDVTVHVQFLRQNGSVIRQEDWTILAGAVGAVGIAYDWGGTDVYDVGWGPDSIQVYTEAKGPQQCGMYFADIFGKHWYSHFNVEQFKEYIFSYNVGIGFPNLGFYEEYDNNNDQARTFRRVFTYYWDESMGYNP